jgi:hydroxymethylglutaryl-CoA reductase (NADPH)
MIGPLRSSMRAATRLPRPAPRLARPRLESTSASAAAAPAAKTVAEEAHRPAGKADKQLDPKSMSDSEVRSAVNQGHIKFFDLENQLGDFERAVRIRRALVEEKVSQSVSGLPFQNFDYNAVHGQCAENVIGYVPIPVGVAGPLLVDGKEYHVPLATTEGALVASTTRGCKALTLSGGVRTEVVNDGISRAPVVEVANARMAMEVKSYVEAHHADLASVFNSTSRFARLKDIKVFIAGKLVYLRFRCTTGDAMGMNMVSKGVDKCLDFLSEKFPMEVLALSGNVCTDKKPSAINWIEGRGKSVVAEAVIPGDVIKSVLKTTVEDVVHVNYCKNLVGSAVAGSIGGMNAHAANIVTAVFLATGQDPAQNVESSTCLTLMEPANGGKDLYMSVNMPSLEVGTVGGGTALPGQSSCLQLLSVRGANAAEPGTNARTLARIIAATVMAGELSLISALSAGHLIRSHLKLNRKPHAPASH